MNIFDVVDAIEFNDTCCGCNKYYNDIGACFKKYKNTIDISPRHTDISHVPLNVIEQIDALDKPYWYNTFWIHRTLPINFGPVKNWFAFSVYTYYGATYIGFFINVKDLRVAIFCKKPYNIFCLESNADSYNDKYFFCIEYAFDSYDDYQKALAESQLSDSEFALYLARKRRLIEF